MFSKEAIGRIQVAWRQEFSEELSEIDVMLLGRLFELLAEPLPDKTKSAKN